VLAVSTSRQRDAGDDVAVAVVVVIGPVAHRICLNCSRITPVSVGSSLSVRGIVSRGAPHGARPWASSPLGRETMPAWRIPTARPHRTGRAPPVRVPTPWGGRRPSPRSSGRTTGRVWLSPPVGVDVDHFLPFLRLWRTLDVVTDRRTIGQCSEQSLSPSLVNQPSGRSM